MSLEMNLEQFPLMYTGSVKNVRQSSDAASTDVIFEYTNDYSVFDWGKMPDTLPGKGEALTALSVYFFEKLADPRTWQDFSTSETAALLFRDEANGVKFRGLLAGLSARGLETHFRKSVAPNAIQVEGLKVVGPTLHTVCGKTVPDYSRGKLDHAGELIPLEVVFRHELVGSSSLLIRQPQAGFFPGQVFPVPFVECFTKLEETDRALSLSEALWVSRLSAECFESVLLHTALVASWLKHHLHERGLQLIDGKLEWGLSARGDLLLVDAIGPDEVRILFEGDSLSKECLREFYRRSRWYADTENAKKLAEQTGEVDWQRYVKTAPEKLPSPLRQAVSHMYPALTNQILGTRRFDVPELSQVRGMLEAALKGAQS